MRGISEKELMRRRLKLTNEASLYNAGKLAMLDELIAECKPLNPLLPIDENTPKEGRELLLLYPGNKIVVGYWDGQNWETSIDALYGDTPTHYQELQAYQKE
ncbi:MAG: hypothetical protein EBU46_01360 [Nitrosomonadaceae bacterium]|nr:hypothetical protein [Nitrosomonadaceae bacterium]